MDSGVPAGADQQGGDAALQAAAEALEVFTVGEGGFVIEDRGSELRVASAGTPWGPRPITRVVAPPSPR